MKRFSVQLIFFASFLSYAICCLLICLTKDIRVIIALSSLIGILYTAIMTLPYKILGDLHKIDAYRRQSITGSKRGIGTFLVEKFQLSVSSCISC